jgi:hypothetical protein
MADLPSVTAPKGLEEIKFEEVEVEISPIGDPQMGRIYANYVQISHNPWEFTMRFCLAPSGADVKKHMKGNKVEIPIIIDIMLSPALMPNLINVLQTNFDKFENKVEESIAIVEKPESQ